MRIDRIGPDAAAQGFSDAAKLQLAKPASLLMPLRGDAAHTLHHYTGMASSE